MKVLVIYGGASSERDVSLQSGASVAAALEKTGHTTVLYDPGDDGTFSGLKDMIADADVVFPIIHGKGAEDGAVQAVLEDLGMPFVGSSSEVSAACLDKWQTLQVVRELGVHTAESQLVSFGQLADCSLIKRPFVLKPSGEGSSVDTFLVRDPQNFAVNNVRSAFERHGKLLVEALVEGVEITVPVLGEAVLPVIEIIPPEGGFFDLENKYNGQTQELCPPEHVSVEQQHQAQVIAKKVHERMGCRDLSRSDMILDKDGVIYFLEVNTLPGMTDESLFPKAAAVHGLGMPQLVDTLVQMACNRSV